MNICVNRVLGSIGCVLTFIMFVGCSSTQVQTLIWSGVQRIKSFNQLMKASHER